MPQMSAQRQPKGQGVPQKGPSPRQTESLRETIEALAIAFMLAMVVRGVQVEPFVIPTGSMAPTLTGRHKELACPQCGYVYSVNASEEIEQVPAESLGLLRVASGVCVNCRYQANLLDEPSYKGDRILVMKFPYDLPNLPGSSPPSRWDVVVFRYPEVPAESYIKRLIGLSGETLRIWYGDIFIKAPGGSEFRQEHRPLAHQRAMQMMVHDDSHRARLLKDQAAWNRWTPTVPEAWTEATEEPGTYLAQGTGPDWSELRYRHNVPDPSQWAAIEAGTPLPQAARPTLITDFYSYNTNQLIDRSKPTGYYLRDPEGPWMQPHWVGDLTVSARLKSDSSRGKVRLTLIEGGVANLAELDLETGEALLRHGDAELGKAKTKVLGEGTHDLEFANVDNRLTLWVDGQPVFGEGLTYEDPAQSHPEPTREDLEPVRISSQGAGVSVSRLVLKRDIYYTQRPGAIDYGNAWDAGMPRTALELHDWLATPEKVAALGPLSWSDYEIGEGRFLMMGDNSPRSQDSRGWHNRDIDWDPTGRRSWEVPASLVTGKAFCVYWPHGKPFGPDIRPWTDFRIPFRPYFERMGLIR